MKISTFSALYALGLCSLGAGLTACSTPVDSSPSPVFGRAVASMQSQVVPAAFSDLPPESSGLAAANAVTRYEHGEQKKPEPQSTSKLNVQSVPYAGK